MTVNVTIIIIISTSFLFFSQDVGYQSQGWKSTIRTQNGQIYPVKQSTISFAPSFKLMKFSVPPCKVLFIYSWSKNVFHGLSSLHQFTQPIIHSSYRLSFILAYRLMYQFFATAILFPHFLPQALIKLYCTLFSQIIFIALQTHSHACFSAL